MSAALNEEHAHTVAYLPAESDSGMFGGNSNWRGPIWMPVNGLLIRALLQYYLFNGDDFQIECPTGSGRMMYLYQVAEEIGRRLTSIFVRDADGRPQRKMDRSVIDQFLSPRISAAVLRVHPRSRLAFPGIPR